MLKRCEREADATGMGRGVGVVSIVISLVASAMLFTTQFGGTGGSQTPASSPVVAQAQSVAVQALAQRADLALAAYKQANGSYGSGALSGIDGASLRRADATSYCLQLVVGSTTLYEPGPGGSLSAQPC